MRILLFLSLALFLTVGGALHSTAQTNAVEFGKNRVQYRDFTWFQYDSPNFRTYWHQNGRELGQFTVQTAEEEYNSILTVLEYRLSSRVEIVVYTDIATLKQSNVGNEESFGTVGGRTKILGNKMFVYYDGDKYHLRRQIREGIANVVMQHILFGDNLQEMVQNAILLNLEKWFTEGLAAYCGEEWNTDLDNHLRDVVLHHTYKDFQDFSLHEPQFAGHAMWYYIGHTYGKSTVANLLYLTRINHSAESGFLYVLGSTFGQTSENFFNYFNDRYTKEQTARATALAAATRTTTVVPLRPEREARITSVRLSPDGKTLAYVTNDKGKIEIFVQPFEPNDAPTNTAANATDPTKKIKIKYPRRRCIFKSGYRNTVQATDYGYPLIAFSRSSKQLMIIDDYRDRIRHSNYDLDTRRIIKKETDLFPNTVQRITSLEFTNNPQELIFSGVSEGWSDVFLFRLKGSQLINITKDVYDDFSPVFFPFRGQRGFLFASTRPTAEVKLPKFDSLLTRLQPTDLYYCNLERQPFEVIRVTNTPTASERNAVVLDSTHFAFLSDASGVLDTYTGTIKQFRLADKRVVRLRTGAEITVPTDSAMPAKRLIDTVVYIPQYEFRAVNVLSRPAALSPENVGINTAIGTANRARVLEMTYEHEQAVVKTYPAVELLNTANQSALALQPTAYRKIIDTPNKTTAPRRDEIRSVLPSNGKDTTPPAPRGDKKPPRAPKDTSKIDIDNYSFQTEFEEVKPARGDSTNKKASDGFTINIIRPNSTPAKPAAAATAAAKPEPVFKSTKILSYFTAFKTDYVVSGLDNSTLFGGIDPYRGANSTPLNAVPMGLLFKGGVRDLFEDYRITGGIRIPLNFRGVEYFVTYDNLVKRLDKRLSFYHREMKESIGTDANVSHHTNLVEGQLRYPLDVFTSIRGLASVRNDRFTPLSTDRPLLDIDQYNRQYVSTRGEFVFDNTSELGLNLRTGTRYKVWVEALKGFQFELDESRTKLDFARGFTSVVGFDFRHYERILRHSIFAVRAAGAASFGSERFLYYLGGVDNPVVPSFSSVIPQPTSGNFAYTAFATNLRGFETNVRNGSSYALINAELRIPVWKYFSKVPPRSPFLQNFQLVGFFDVGSAWLGISPFSADNPLNTLTVHTTNSAVTVVVNYARDPFVYGYGGGLRTTLLGYFLRLDIAQGIETGEPQKLLWHFSVGTDF